MRNSTGIRLRPWVFTVILLLSAGGVWAAGNKLEIEEESFTKKSSADLVFSSKITVDGVRLEVAGTWLSTRLWMNIDAASGYIKVAGSSTKALALAALRAFQIDVVGDQLRWTEVTSFGKGIVLTIEPGGKKVEGLVLSVPGYKGEEPKSIILDAKSGKVTENGFDLQVERFQSDRIVIRFLAWPAGDPRIYHF